jgi:hypothetical protein
MRGGPRNLIAWMLVSNCVLCLACMAGDLCRYFGVLK